MKRVFLWLVLGACGVSLCVFFALRPLSIFLIKKQIMRACDTCRVSISDCRIIPKGEFTCSGIAIKKGQEYTAKLKEARVNFSLASLLKRTIVNFELRIDSLSVAGVTLKDGVLTFDLASGIGKFGIKEIIYNKLTLKDIGAFVRLKGNTVFLDSLFAQIFDGRIRGKAKASINKATYEASINSEDLDIAMLIKALDLNEKFEMTGRLGGVVDIGGQSLKLTMLKGEFRTRADGGTLTIKDTTFLENMAKTSGQSVDLIVESMKDYRYNTGVVDVLLDQGNLMVTLTLEGTGGKRNLDVVVHDFSIAPPAEESR